MNGEPMEYDPELGQVREKHRIPLEEGERIADKVRKDIGPLAQIMVLVGSIRRRRPTVADVEFVVLPKDLGEFDKFAREIGFEAGSKRRKYTALLDGVKVELYVAHKPEELGAMVQTYTGDYLFNIAIRSKAKAMGYKLDQYGIWKGQKPVFQSPEERDIFDFVDMEWHEPEERSMARRSELNRIARALLARDLDPGERAFVADMRLALRDERYLPPEEEEMLMSLEHQYLPGKVAPTIGSRFAMGAEELIELGQDDQGPEPCTGLWQAWQAAYDQGVGHGGRVTDVWAESGSQGGVAIVIRVQEQGEAVYYTPYIDRNPSEDDVAAIEQDPELWLCGRLAGTEPRAPWDWGPIYRTIPVF